MSSCHPAREPRLDTPKYTSEDSRRIFAAELLAHRQSLQQCLEDWIQEEHRILDRTLASLSAHQQQTEASQVFLVTSATHAGMVDDKAGNLAACAPEKDGVMISNQGPEVLEAYVSSDSPLADEEGVERSEIHQQASQLGFARASSKKLRLKPQLTSKHAVMKVVSLIVYSKLFESLCAAVILANAVLLGVASDYAMANLENPEHPVMSAIELGFCCFYFLEICLRMAVLGRWYFTSDDWAWNWFDFSLVAMSIWDQIEARLNISASALENLSFLRLLRLMKMLKLLRMIRLMRAFRELRLILYSVLGCVKAMFWAVVLICTTSYMFGICFLQGCTSYLQSHELETLSSDVVNDIDEYWDSIGTVMLSLYMAATAGREWSAVARPLKSVGWIFYLLFLTYIAFFAFVVMNTVTSLFIETMISNADKDQQAIIQRQLEKKDRYIDKLAEFYAEIDEDGDGCVTFDEFCHHVNRPQMRAFAASLEIDVLDATQFFSILSEQGQRHVDVETFVVGCIKLRGAARSMDLMDLAYAHRQAQSEARANWEEQLGRLEVLEKLMGKMSLLLQRDNMVDI